jgi:WD40 repeat protein
MDELRWVSPKVENFSARPAVIPLILLMASIALTSKAVSQPLPESRATPPLVAESRGEPPITAVAFSPGATSVVAVSQRGIAVYDWPELREQRTIEVSMFNVHAVRFSPDGKSLAVGGGYPAETGMVQVFSWPEGNSLAQFDDHTDSVRAVVWLDDDNLITASMDRSIKRWNLAEGAADRTLEGHSRSVDALAMLRDGTTLVSAGADQSLRVWDVRSGTLLRNLNQHTQPVLALALHPGEDGLPMVASAANDRTIRFWQPTIGRMVRYVRLPSDPLAIAWTNDGSRLLATCVDGHLRLVDPVGVTVTREMPMLEGWAYALAVHPQGQAAVVAGADGQIRKAELRKAKPTSADLRP